MSIDNHELPARTIQELRTADAPRVYRPHTTTRPKTFDWDALTPTCTECSTRSGSVSAITGMCRACDPTYAEEQEPTQDLTARPPRPSKPAAQAPRAPRATSAPRPRRDVGRPRTPLDVDAIIEAYTGGQMISDIATALHVGYDRVRIALIDAGIELRDDRGRHWRTHTCEHGTIGRPTSCPACVEARKAKRRVNRPHLRAGSMPNSRNPIDEQAVITAYLEGTSAARIAKDLGVTPRRIRDTVARHGIELRDDRQTNSGGATKDYDPALVEQVRGLYLDEGLTQIKVADRLNIGIHVVQRLMSRHDIPARPANHVPGHQGKHKIPLEQHADILRRYAAGETGRQIAADYGVSNPTIYSILTTNEVTRRHRQRSTPGHDGAATLKAAIADLGVPVSEIKSWAIRQSLLLEVRPGIPPRRVIDAYIAAHTDGAA